MLRFWQETCVEIDRIVQIVELIRKSQSSYVAIENDLSNERTQIREGCSKKKNYPYLSLVMTNPDFRMVRKQRRRSADQRLRFRYTDSTIPLLPKSEIPSLWPSARFMSDLVGNPQDRFSHNKARGNICEMSFQVDLDFFVTDYQIDVVLKFKAFHAR